jgi:signal transduction histidine kinase
MKASQPAEHTRAGTRVPPRTRSRPRPRIPRRTIRLRLTVLSGAMFLASGAMLLAVTYLLVRFAFPTTAVHNYSASRPPAPAEAVGGAAPTPSSPAKLPSPAALRALDAQQHDADLDHLLIVGSLALLALAFASVLLGWFVAGRLLAPLRTITAAARETSSAGLDRRLALNGPDDELKELADTFDALLGRLERSFGAQRQFVANASHELRTPLTLQRALLEAALTDPNSTVASLTATCKRLVATTTQQDRLIEALLTLAVSERGIDRREPLNLAEIVEEVVAQRAADAECARIHLDTDLRDAHTEGDPDLAERLVANLVDNALRHNIPTDGHGHGYVEVTTGFDPVTGTAVVRVANSGPVVDAAEISRIFDPFHRAGARTRGARDRNGGHGLGLSIVAAVAAAHDARVEARGRPGGGLTVHVGFPAAAERAGAGRMTADRRPRGRSSPDRAASSRT